MNFFDELPKKVFIIAEIGSNHNGDYNIAKQLIDVAVDAGADAVKFQTFRGRDIVTPKVLASEYPDWDIKGFTYWHEFLDSIALPFDKHREVFDYAKSVGLIPFSTPTSIQSVDFLEKLGVLIYKVASMDITNVQLLHKIAKTGKPVILSTGMADEKEIERAVSCFDINKLVILHCVCEYPIRNYHNVNLKLIEGLHERFGCFVGFSDHSLGYELSIAAVACGARIIEKHITLNRNSSVKAEHHFALEPAELKDFVSKIRQIEAALGKKSIDRSIKEQKNKTMARRSLHVNKNLNTGSVLREEDISILRPADGAAPDEISNFIGRTIKRNKNAWDPLTKEDI